MSSLTAEQTLAFALPVHKRDTASCGCGEMDVRLGKVSHADRRGRFQVQKTSGQNDVPWSGGSLIWVFTSQCINRKTIAEFWTGVLLTMCMYGFDALLMKHHRHQAALSSTTNSLPHGPERNPTSTINTSISCHRHHHSDGGHSLNSPRLFLRFTSSSVLPASADLSLLLEEKRKMSQVSNPNLTSGRIRLCILIRT
jgi:hypothetical protein